MFFVSYCIFCGVARLLFLYPVHKHNENAMFLISYTICIMKLQQYYMFFPICCITDSYLQNLKFCDRIIDKEERNIPPEIPVGRLLPLKVIRHVQLQAVIQLRTKFPLKWMRWVRSPTPDAPLFFLELKARKESYILCSIGTFVYFY